MTLWLEETYAAASNPGSIALVPPHARPSEPAGAAARSTVAALDPRSYPLSEELPPALFAERRLERRADCGFDVAAAAATDCLDTALGEAVDISVSGVRLVMDKAAQIGPVDLIVADLILAARVVGHHELDDGRHAWHVQVLDADDGWLELVRSG